MRGRAILRRDFENKPSLTQAETGFIIALLWRHPIVIGWSKVENKAIPFNRIFPAGGVYFSWFVARGKYGKPPGKTP